MLKAAEKYNVVFYPTILTESQKEEMPFWYHIGLDTSKNFLSNGKWAKMSERRT
jgi:hypothetical protein